jgi:hypothetical protein
MRGAAFKTFYSSRWRPLVPSLSLAVDICILRFAAAICSSTVVRCIPSRSATAVKVKPYSNLREKQSRCRSVKLAPSMYREKSSFFSGSSFCLPGARGGSLTPLLATGVTRGDTEDPSSLSDDGAGEMEASETDASPAMRSSLNQEGSNILLARPRSRSSVISASSPLCHAAGQQTNVANAYMDLVRNKGRIWLDMDSPFPGLWSNAVIAYLSTSIGSEDTDKCSLLRELLSIRAHAEPSTRFVTDAINSRFRPMCGG